MRRCLVLITLLVCYACGTPQGGPAMAPAPAPPAEAESPALVTWHFLREKYDRDGDGRITSDEYTRSRAGFRRLDADRDEVVSVADFDPRWDGKPRSESRFQYGLGGPEVGDPAPEFELSTTAGKRLSLASLRAERPVALVFGSFT
ncbi:MAG: hypothetical protein HOP15_11940 [Planctomycetes bacterium]|nr:hypothetical protein [Planctomycetota bacterium]